MSRPSHVSLLRPSHFHSSRYGNYRTLRSYRNLPYPTQAVEDLHKVGFIHRDLKPTNLSIGHKVYGSLLIDTYRTLQLKHAVYVFDFGLCRQIMVAGKDGKMALREPRKKVYGS